MPWQITLVSLLTRMLMTRASYPSPGPWQRGGNSLARDLPSGDVKFEIGFLLRAGDARQRRLHGRQPVVLADDAAFGGLEQALVQRLIRHLPCSLVSLAQRDAIGGDQR